MAQRGSRGCQRVTIYVRQTSDTASSTMCAHAYYTPVRPSTQTATSFVLSLLSGDSAHGTRLQLTRCDRVKELERTRFAARPGGDVRTPSAGSPGVQRTPAQHLQILDTTRVGRLPSIMQASGTPRWVCAAIASETTGKCDQVLKMAPLAAEQVSLKLSLDPRSLASSSGTL